jgi:hypothetical protein
MHLATSITSSNLLYIITLLIILAWVIFDGIEAHQGKS